MAEIRIDSGLSESDIPAASNSFETINCPAGTDPVADSSTDTLNLTSADSSVTITGNSTTDTVDFSVNAANKTLSNLTNPTAVNRDLVGTTGTDWVIQTSNGGASASFGVTVKSGDSTDSSSGGIDLTTGSASTSSSTGYIAAYTGNNSGGTTGDVQFSTGSAGSGTSGTITINSGVGNTASGDVFLISGSSTTVSGDITLSTGNSSAGNSGVINLNTGTAAGTRGSVFMHSGNIEFTQDGTIAIENMLTLNSKNRAAPSGDTSQENIVSEEQDSSNLFAIFTATNAGANSTGTQNLEIGTGRVNNAGATGDSGELYIVTGPSIATDNTTLTGAASLGSGGHSGGGGTGGVSVRSGNVSGASSTGNTGDMNISSGSISSNNTTGTTGGVIVTSGTQLGESADGDTGATQLTSGSIVDAASTGASGLVFITSGDHAGTGNTGDVLIYSGQHTGDGNTGKIQIYTGENSGSSGTGGNIELWCGSGPNGYGFVDLQASSLKITGSFCPTQENTQDITADDTNLIITNLTYKRVSSNSAVATDRTFVLPDGDRAGHMIMIEWVGTNAGELSTTNARLSGGVPWLPTQYDTITLIWNGTDWIELCRSVNA